MPQYGYIARFIMKSTFKNYFGIIGLLIITLLYVPFMCFALGNVNSLGNIWTVSPMSVDNVRQADSVILELSDKIDYMYFFVGNVYDEVSDGKIEVTVQTGSSLETLKKTNYVAKHTLYLKAEDGKAIAPGWHKLNNGGTDRYSVTAKYIKISLKNNLDIYEIAFTDEKNNVVSASCVGGIVWNNEKHVFVSADDSSADVFSGVADGQNAFALNTYSAFTNKEAEQLVSAKNILSSRGFYLSDSFGPLSLFFTCIGLWLFGLSPFALRVLPFIFSIATNYLIYYLAKKLFTTEKYALLTVCSWIIGGLSLCIAGVGLPISIALFFVVAAFCCLANFYFSPINSNKPLRTLKHSLLSGMFASIAIATHVVSVVALPALALLYVISCNNKVKKQKSLLLQAEGLQKEFERESTTKLLKVIIVFGIVSFVVLPLFILIVGYGMFFPFYAQYYASNNIFYIIFHGIAKNWQVSGSEFFITWLFGLGGDKLSGLSEKYIFSNKALVVLSTVTIVLITIFYTVLKGKNAKKEQYSAVLDEYKSVIEFLLISFLATFVCYVCFAGRNFYYDFAYLLFIMVLFIPFAHKIFSACLGEALVGVAQTLASVIVILFFCVAVVGFLSITIPHNLAEYLFLWMI